MKITPAHVVMPIVCILVGLSLIYVGLFGGWGLVWAMGGGFFVTVGVSAIVLTLAWVLPGSLGALLRRPLVSILIVCAVLAMMALTIYVGIGSR